MSDPVIDKEIQNLIDENVGDKQRLEFIQKSFREEKKIYNSDLKYLTKLLEEHSKDEDILERLDFLTPKPAKKTTTLTENLTHVVDTDLKYCTNCTQLVRQERHFSKGVLLLFLFFGIPGLLYYFVKGKTCPLCKHDQWGVPPEQ